MALKRPSWRILALLVRANLIHEHLHGHGGVVHSHPHETEAGHTRPDPAASGGLEAATS